MPMRPKKPVAALASAVPRLDNQPRDALSDYHPPFPPSPPPVPDPSPAPRRANAPQRPVSLVVRNARRSRNTSFYASAPRYNHYLLARSFVENGYPQKSLTPKQKSRGNHQISPSPLFRDTPPPDSIISDFVWRFSAPYLDPKTRDAFAALKSYDPETFKELIAGLE